MTNVRRFMAVVALLGLVAWISSSSQGQQGKKNDAGATAQITPAKQVSLLAEASDSRFAAAGAHTYQPVQGDAYFAMQLQPTLDKTPARPRDYLIMLSTAATQGGPGWIASHQIAEGIIETARDGDRVSLWTVNEPAFTKNISKEFLLPKDAAEGVTLRKVLAQYRAKEFPSGNTDLKDALKRAIASFDAKKGDRQRIILFLGDGLSTHNPMSEQDRNEIAARMAKEQIAFFPVPLGVQLNPNTLHGLANSTGGVVLRTRVEEEKLVDAMKRYEAAFAGSILYNAKVQLPAEMTDVCPSTLPPLRSDSPTLVVGRLKKPGKQFDYTVTGKLAGQKAETTVKATEKVIPPNLDNFFLVGMVDQWGKAKESHAVLRADRALAFAYEQTRLQHMEFMESAQMALEDGKLDAARRIFKQARLLAPHDAQADAGIKIVERLKDGTLTKDMLRKQFDKRGKVDKLQTVNGKPQWVKVDLVQVAQNDDKVPLPPEKKPQPGLGPDNLLKEIRDRQAIEEQKVTQSVDEAIRVANRNLKDDPDGTLDLLRNLSNRVKDHPDLGGKVRDTLASRLQQALRDSATRVQELKLKKQGQVQATAQTEKNVTREQERKSFEERVDEQFRLFKNLMGEGRHEERTKMAIMDAMVRAQDEAIRRGQAVPVGAKAMYDIASAAGPLQTHNTLVRKREAGFLNVLMSVEKSHVPYPDEPGIYFPPLATWKAIIAARKDKYDVISLPDDPAGRKAAYEVSRLLEEVIDTKGLQDPEGITLKTALEYFSDKFGGKLSILVDKEAFVELAADAPDPYTEKVSLPPAPSKMAMKTALRLIVGQVAKGAATYVIRRDFVEITTTQRYLDDKVLRIYPVGELVVPLSNATPQLGMTMAASAQWYKANGILPTMSPQLAMMLYGAGGGGMGMGMPMGGGMGMGMPMMGGMGMGMPMMGGMGMGMPMMGGMGMGMPMMGGMGMGMPMMGGMGMGMPMMGGMGVGGGLQMGGGGFQASFNGSLGALGATQAMGLINMITSIVDPGNWNQPQQLQPLMGMGGFPGMMGMLGMVGMMGAGMVGAGPPGNNPPNPNANSIDFFPPALALIVRAPSRVHTSITGGIIGGKIKRPEAAFIFDAEKKILAQAGKQPGIKVGPQRGADLDPKVVAAVIKQHEVLDPTKVWNKAFAEGGVTSALVVATADFLFEAGQSRHAAEFLKANLRHGVVVRPWVYEALAIALEASGGDPEEIRRARLSGIALDPTDAQGFTSAARAMADRGQFDRALAFCRQAALLEPADYHPYEAALAYAESAKDPAAMEWAVGNLVSQDWPVDNVVIQQAAKKRLTTLAATLKTDKRAGDASKLEAALQRLNQRDLRVKLVWDNVGGPCELEMQVKEPSGSICNLQQKQSPGGGIMIGYNLTDKEPNTEYVVAQAFNGDYEITIARVYGQVLNNRARLEILQNAGTAQQVRKVHVINLDQNVPIKVTLKDGQRTELATVSPAANQRPQRAKTEKETSAFYELRAVANPNFYGATGPRGGAGSPNQAPTVATLAARDAKNKAQSAPLMQNAVHPAGSVQMTTQLRVNADQRGVDMVIRPFFQSVNAAQSRPMNLSVIPGGGN